MNFWKDTVTLHASQAYSFNESREHYVMENITDESVKQAHQEKIQQVFQEVGKVVVGQQYMVNRLLIGLFTNGHILLEGVPGLAKTLTVNTLSQVLHLDFKRIQFTPDLLPADLIGTMIYNQQRGDFEVKKGPIFSNLILADEVNRSRPRCSRLCWSLCRKSR